MTEERVNPPAGATVNGNARGNADLWRQYGDYVLMAMPYADEVLVEARGSTLVDADGKQILDLAAGMFCSILGHNHPKFVRRIVEQAERLVHTGTQFLSPAVLEASYALAQVAPGDLQKSIFLSTGTEANEFAFRLAKAYTGRTGIVGLSRGYYGTSLATRSCSGLFSHRLKDSLPVVPENFCVPITPQCVGCFNRTTTAACNFPCFDIAEHCLGDWNDVAAVIVEPVLSAGGMLFPPEGYFRKLAEIVRRSGALLIVDEAQTGFGRTGKWFAFEHHGIQPDILTLSKSVGNGFPAAAVITTAEIADQTASDGLWSLSSHQSDPLAAAAVAAVIEVVREENLAAQAAETGAYFIEQLRSLASRNPEVRNVRGQGLMIGFDITPANSEEAAAITTGFMYGCRRRGVHLTFGYGSVNIRIIPPLTITRAEIDRAVAVMEDALREAIASPDSRRQGSPGHANARRLFNQHPAKRIAQLWWRSSPEEWVEKGGRILRKHFGSRA